MVTCHGVVDDDGVRLLRVVHPPNDRIEEILPGERVPRAPHDERRKLDRHELVVSQIVKLSGGVQRERKQNETQGDVLVVIDPPFLEHFRGECDSDPCAVRVAREDPSFHIFCLFEILCCCHRGAGSAHAVRSTRRFHRDADHGESHPGQVIGCIVQVATVKVPSGAVEQQHREFDTLSAPLSAVNRSFRDGDESRQLGASVIGLHLYLVLDDRHSIYKVGSQTDYARATQRRSEQPSLCERRIRSWLRRSFRGKFRDFVYFDRCTSTRRAPLQRAPPQPRRRLQQLSSPPSASAQSRTPREPRCSTSPRGRRPPRR